MILGVCAQLMLMLAYFWGQFDDVAVQRFSLPSHVVWVLAPLGATATLHHRERWLRWGTAAAGMCLVTFSLPATSGNVFGHRNSAALLAQWVDAFAEARGRTRAVWRWTISRPGCGWRGAWTLVPEDDLGPGFVLEELEEFHLNPVKKQRISRVVAIDPGQRPPPWPVDLPPGRPIWNLDRGQPFLETWTRSLP